MEIVDGKVKYRIDSESPSTGGRTEDGGSVTLTIRFSVKLKYINREVRYGRNATCLVVQRELKICLKSAVRINWTLLRCKNIDEVSG